ncbi:LysR family transcriptional regulator [Rhodobacterales bacterium HKCCE2091]|nr:LysR family transcriptional regulator [Rhodobacterales bacterium HKCCE2091]
MDWRDIPSLAALRAFEAAARLQSHSAAARELNVTHAAIAQHVRALEDRFGQPLMERSGRAMQPTAAGARLAADLARGFAEIAAGVRALDATTDAGPLALTTTRTFAENWLMPRLAGFWGEHPEIPLSISADDRVADLRRDGLHLAIRYGRGKWPGLEAEFLTAANTIVVASPSLAARLPGGFEPGHPGSLAALTDLPWLIDESYAEFTAWMRSKGLEPRDLKATQLQSNALVLAGTRAGLGLSVQSTPLVEDDIAAGRLVMLSEQQDDDLAYFITTLPGVQPDRLKTFIRWLRRQIAA